MFVYALLIFLIAALASIVVMLVFGMRTNKTLRRIVATALVGTIISFALCMAIGAGVKADAAKCQAEYTDLMLYYNTVDNSANEYVRYNYFNKVQEYNDWYAKLVAFESDFWIGNLMHESWLDGCGLIDFQLHGDEYVG